MDVRLKAVTGTALILTAVSLCTPRAAIPKEHGSSRAITTPASFAQRSGAAVYSQMCSRCHGADGRATTPKGKSLGATDLTSADWTPDAARDGRIITKGKESMPSFKAKLSTAEIEAVVSYIRRFKQ